MKLNSKYFSGSLHPSIQDIQGNPRRDPKTILQILRDLFSATNQQQFIPQVNLKRDTQDKYLRGIVC